MSLLRPPLLAFLLVVFGLAPTPSRAGDAFADYVANRPDYILKEGTVGSPRSDIPWLRLSIPEAAQDPKAVVICEVTATVLHAYDAINLNSHTEYIAEVTLQESDRPVLRFAQIVIHGDRWNDLATYHQSNPFQPGCTVVFELRGIQADESTWFATLKSISPKETVPPPETPATK